MNSQIILIVDDDHDFRLILASAFESRGYRVYTADNGDEGLKMLNEIPKPQLILIDYLMPISNGETFLNTLKSSPDFKNVPVLFITGATNIPKLPEGTEVLRKPFTVETLYKITQRILA